MSAECTDFDKARSVTAGSVGCEDCEKTGDWWVHLRVCLDCGHVGCCDSSPNRHATAHAQRTGHVIIASFEPGEEWAYCYLHDLFIPTLPEGFDFRRVTTPE